MSDLISRQAAIAALGERPEVWEEWADEYELGQQRQYDAHKLAIETLPSAQKHGKWNKYPGEVVSPDGLWGEVLYECPYCGWAKHVPTNYCPQCGAKLEGARWMT